MAITASSTRCMRKKELTRAFSKPPVHPCIHRPVATPLAAHTATSGWHAADSDAPIEAVALTRRGFFAVSVGAGLYLAAPKAIAEDQAWNKFTGYALQPDLYLGQGYARPMNYDKPAYTFEFPGSWEEEPVSKTDKSTMGMDGLVRDPKRKRTKAFVIALGGKDYEMARLTDTTSALKAMAGGDPDLREAVSNATAVRAEKKTIDGVETYCYDIDGDKAHYLAKVAIKNGTVFGLFASTPVASWEVNKDGMMHIYDTFTLL